MRVSFSNYTKYLNLFVSHSEKLKLLVTVNFETFRVATLGESGKKRASSATLENSSSARSIPQIFAKSSARVQWNSRCKFHYCFLSYASLPQRDAVSDNIALFLRLFFCARCHFSKCHVLYSTPSAGARTRSELQVTWRVRRLTYLRDLRK